MMTNIIVGAIIAAILAAAIAHIVRAKKRGVKCIGCPDSGCCSHSVHREYTSGKDNSGCGCGCGK